jgi:DNA topoisomerase-1
MKPAQFDRNTITITSVDNGTICKASGSVIKFDGFLKVMKDTKKR